MQKKGMKIMKFYFQANLSCICTFFVVPLYPNLVVVHIILHLLNSAKLYYTK